MEIVGCWVSEIGMGFHKVGTLFEWFDRLGGGMFRLMLTPLIIVLICAVVLFVLKKEDLPRGKRRN